MTRTVRTFCAALLLCAALFTACTNSAPQIPFEDGQLYALAYLGYQQIEDPDAFRSYLGDRQPPVHYVSGGDYYLVIPREGVTAVRLYRNDILTGSTTLFYEQSDAGPFVVQCNVSDIFPDLTVELTAGEETVQFSPFVSLENGEVLPGERGLLLTK